MNLPTIAQIAKNLVINNKGLLAMDESIPSCNKRFNALGIPATVDMRRAYRDLLITTPHLSDYINGVILCDETIRQMSTDGTPFTDILKKAGIGIGIKVDTGEADMKDHPGEKITQGLDGLGKRLATYAKMGASFAKWRGEIIIGEDIPSMECIEANAKVLALYAQICQEAGLVPIVEPEVDMAGNHSIERCLEVTRLVLQAVFTQLQLHHVALEAIILKPNMVLPGLGCDFQVGIDEMADTTVSLLLAVVPSTVPGIAFLSGGQPYQLATSRLNAMHVRYKDKLPWALTFSYSRALQQPALSTWLGNSENINRAQEQLLHRALCNCAAMRGKYDAEMEYNGRW